MNKETMKKIEAMLPQLASGEFSLQETSSWTSPEGDTQKVILHTPFGCAVCDKYTLVLPVIADEATTGIVEEVDTNSVPLGMVAEYLGITINQYTMGMKTTIQNASYPYGDDALFEIESNLMGW